MVRYATIWKTRKQALASGKRGLKMRKIVYGKYGGRIKSKQAKVGILKVNGGYIPIARRK